MKHNLNHKDIRLNEVNEWMMSSSLIKKHVLEAYTCTIDNFLGLADPRIQSNNYFVNYEFERIPTFFIAYTLKYKCRLIELSSLFVFEQHRSKGLGSAILDMFKRSTMPKQVIQVAANLENKQALKFYEKHGFTSVKIGLKDDFGSEYVDFFWSKSKFLIKPPKAGSREIIVETID